METCTSSQIALLEIRISNALIAGDLILASTLSDQLQRCLSQAESDGSTKGVIYGGFNTNNPTLNPIQPHGDQNIQRSFWNLTGNPCGRCSIVPRYWKMTFDWTYHTPSATFESLFGVSFADNNTPNGEPAPHWDFRNWFEDIARPGQPGVVILKRGGMARRPFGSGEVQFQEAVYARAAAEYDMAFWKNRVDGSNPDRPDVAINGLNVAWFLWYEAKGSGATAGGVTNAGGPSGYHTNTDSGGSDQGEVHAPGWQIALIENTLTVPTSNGGTYNNAYQFLTKYKLVGFGRDAYADVPIGHGGRQTLFNCLGTNRFEMYENNLILPRHVITLEPFWP